MTVAVNPGCDSSVIQAGEGGGARTDLRGVDPS